MFAEWSRVCVVVPSSSVNHASHFFLCVTNLELFESHGLPLLLLSFQVSFRAHLIALLFLTLILFHLS